MRNLKRALSLAMASIMILGMMVIGAGAVSYDEFSDKDKIVNKEAVNTMVSLGVINGKTDGSYDPTGIVTRAEMAKLIAVMLTGGKDPTLGNLTSNFTDTKGNWADSYIAYCANLGIINGRGDNTFGPNEAVNGTAAAKMLLTALGYRSDIEKLTGAAWEINTNVLANKIDLFNGIESILPNEGLSRDNTAQMIYNAVQANEVEYKNNYGEYSGVIYAQPNGTVLENRFKVIKVEGVVEANDIFSVNQNTAPVGKIRLTDTNSAKTAADGTVTDSYAGTYAVPVATDLVGKRIVIYVKFQNNLAPNAAASTVIGTPILSSKNVIVETTGKLKDETKVKDALKGSGIAVDAKTKAILVTDGTTGAGTITGIQTIPGVKQTFVDHNNDGKVDYIIQVKESLSKVSVYNEKDEKLTLSGISGSIDFVDIANPKDVAKDDYVRVAKYDDTYVLTKAESVTGKVTAYDSANEKISIDGTAYAVGAGKNLAADLDTASNSDLSGMVDGEYSIYLDAFGNVLAYTEGDASVGNYAVITAATKDGNTGFESGKVKLLMADGTSGTYTVNLLASAKKWDASVNTGSNSTKESNMAAKLTSSLVGTLVSYTLDGSTVTIGQPKYTNSTKYDVTGTGGTDFPLQSSRSAYKINNISVMTDNSTAFFIQDKNGDFTAVAGLSNLRSSALAVTSANAITYAAKTNGTKVAKAVYAVTSEEYTPNKDYAYIIDTYTKTTEGNDTIYTYPVVLEDGKMTTLKSKTEDGLTSGYVYSYNLNNGGFADFSLVSGRTINSMVVTDSGKGAVALTPEKNSGAASTSYPINSKTQVWDVSDADVKDASTVYASKMSVNDKVAIVLDSDGNVTAAFVKGAITGEMTAAPSAMELKVSGGTLVDSKGNTVTLGTAGGSANWVGAIRTTGLSLDITLGTNQTAKIETKANGTATPFYSYDLTAGFNGSKTLYVAQAAENGTKVDVTVTVKETGKADRVIVHAVVVGNSSIAPTAQTGTVAKVNANPTSAVDIKIALKTDATTEWNVTNAKATDKVNLALTYTGSAKVSKVEVTGGLKLANAVTEGTTFNAANPLAVYTMGTMDAAEAGTLKITVATTNSDKAPVESTYTFNIEQTPIHTLNIPGMSLAKHYVGDSITMSTVTDIGEFYTADGTTFTAKATAFVMPDADVNMDIGFYSVAAPAATTGTVSGYAGAVSVAADKTYVKAGETITLTVTAAADTTPATAASVTATVTVTGGTTTVSGTAVFSTAELVSGATKTITITVDAASTANITAIATALT